MSDTVIRVENLGKKYILGHQKQERYTALRDVMANGAKSFGRKVLKPFGKKIDDPAVNEFWALKDVSFEIKQGDRVGIIGRNGAGKSTLLKILSRITEPTNGSIRIKGRVASLLEVGTGFHPELTGRENIYLNGAILGMSKAEIKSKFDEIVAFAEVEKFLDTPVKRYSSGMYVRLAFAVAAHLEPEILVVDEVLAVGDSAFQKKCLGKMEEVGKEGRTVIFVSHNMGVMESLCNQGIYLKSGQINFAGSMKQAISIYLSSSRNSISYNHGTLFKIDPEKLTSQNFHVTEVTLLDENNCIKPVVKTWDYLKIRIKYFSPKKIAEGSVVLEISTFSGSKLIEYSTQPLSGLQFSFVPGESYADCIIPSLPLAAGDYKVNVGLAVPMTEWLCREENLASLEVADSDVYQSGFPPNQQRTVVAVEHHWEVVSQ
jgi:lipopolysaccharide transport system ATP-binding protein